jgi:hypothetical protein
MATAMGHVELDGGNNFLTAICSTRVAIVPAPADENLLVSAGIPVFL